MSGQHTSSGHNAANAGAGASNLLKEGLTKVHGLGEAIRGNVNTFADNVTNTDDTRSRAEVDRGVSEIQTGKFQGAHTAGVTPNDTAQERAHEPVVGSSGLGAHSTTAGTTTTTTGTTGTTKYV